MSKKLLLCTAIGATMAGLSPLHAIGQALEEVIVTAQKTEESIQDVPISIQSLDASVLENNAVANLSDIKALVPAMRITPFPTAQENLLIAIRGVTPAAIELTQDTPTAVHINGVYIARSNGLNMGVADLERIEVLKGPQGTLYGRNATAGAVNMITAKPTGEFGIKQQVTIAENDQFISKTGINFPITDNLAGKLSYFYDTKDGYIDNTAPNSIDFGERTAQAARFDLRWTPNVDLTIDYGFDWSQSRYFGTPGQCMERGSVVTFGGLVDPAECGRKFKDKIAFYGDHPENEVSAFGHTLNIEWDISDSMTFRSITGYREFDDDYYGILFGGGPNITGGSVDVNVPGLYLPAQANRTKADQFSQEFQLLGDIGEQISYSAGLYYFKEDGTETKARSASMIRVVPVSAYCSPLANPGAGTCVSLNGPRDLDATNESWAVFGQLTWTPPILDNNLEIIPGLRYTTDKREASMFEKRGGTYWVTGGVAQLIESGLTYTGYPDGPISNTGAPARYKDDFSETTPSLTVQYHWNSDIMTYAKWVQGYKSGGTAIRASTTTAFSNGFDPETLTSVELGLKSSLFDQRVRANLAVFQSEFKDQQVSVRNIDAVPPGSPSVPFDILNAGRSTYTGAELELTVAVTEQFRVGVNYAYLDFEYDKVEDPLAGDVTDFYHLVIPHNSYSVTLDYSVPEFSFGKLDFNLSYSYIDEQSTPYQDTFSTTGALVSKADRRKFVTPDYGIWNGRVALSDIKVGPGDRGALTVALWGKNLADKEYVNYGFVTVDVAETYQSFWGEPRTFGLDVIYEY